MTRAVAKLQYTDKLYTTFWPALAYGPCMGIKVNLWEHAKVYITVICIIWIIVILTIILIIGRFVVILCTRSCHVGGCRWPAQRVWCPWIQENQAGWAGWLRSYPILAVLLDKVARFFCLSFIVFDFWALIFPLYQQTEATLMCMEPSWMMRYEYCCITPFNIIPLTYVTIIF